MIQKVNVQMWNKYKIKRENWWVYEGQKGKETGL